jgi:hypothetical protein
MAHNATCFDARTYLAAEEYENGSLNADVGGACMAIASLSRVLCQRKRVS